MYDSEEIERMPLMTWTDEMSLGIKTLDEDHKRLIELLNQLHQEVISGNTRAALESAIEQLIDYTQYHFTREENLFTGTRFPDAEEHKHEHEMLIKRAVSLQARFKSGQIPELSLETMGFLQRWLSDHIMGSDRDYIPYLKASGIN
jgi:hemerythrin